MKSQVINNLNAIKFVILNLQKYKIIKMNESLAFI